MSELIQGGDVGSGVSRLIECNAPEQHQNWQQEACAYVERSVATSPGLEQPQPSSADSTVMAAESAQGTSEYLQASSKSIGWGPSSGCC